MGTLTKTTGTTDFSGVEFTLWYMTFYRTTTVQQRMHKTISKGN